MKPIITAQIPSSTEVLLDPNVCQKARMSRDSRFDGLFFTAVKTTGIYCRSVCPATPPKESNVTYYRTAVLAANAGFRPCLRCRPDSAPFSAAWLGSQALLLRAIRLIDEGILEEQSLHDFSNYLGVSDRYLRHLFVKNFGVPPKKYALYQQCLFAKNLLHQTHLPVNQIALACGFKSVRRFNDCFIKMIKITPTDIRRKTKIPVDHHLKLKLSYRPPYDWQSMQQFIEQRAIKTIETISKDSYGRTFCLHIQGTSVCGEFKIKHIVKYHAFEVAVLFEEPKHLLHLRTVVNNIRRVFDLDADTQHIEHHLQHVMPHNFSIQRGLRIPGIWSPFEAGIRAILGQQVSVKAAHSLVSQLVENLGSVVNNRHYFPTPESIVNSDLSFFKMPAARKQSLKNLSHHVLQSEIMDCDEWLNIKGIGPWTVNYSKLRGLNDPDVFLSGDSGINHALKGLNLDPKTFDSKPAAPWRSYLTFHLWSQL